MKKNDRLNALLGFLEENPNDAFTLYGIALEYMSSGEPKAQVYFDLLLDNHAEYLPTYYKAAEYFTDQGEFKKAIKIFEKGIALAEKQQELKTLQELKGAYQNLLFEMD
jgi:tetratricopeptide (TPR) repeat protein